MRDAVRLAIDGVPILQLEIVEDLLVAGELADIEGPTSPPAISRSVASPEAETPSYSPLCISVTISSDELPS